MSSIVLNPGVKEMLMADTKDFLKSEKVCACVCVCMCVNVLCLQDALLYAP